MVACHPVGIRKFDGIAEDPVAGLIVYAPGRALEPVEHDVLVEARDHAVGQLETAGIDRIELRARHRVLPVHDLLQALDLDQSESRRELAHPEVEAVDLVAGLAVVAKRASMLNDLGAAGDEYAAL